ncbi:MAG: LPD25 domain-containing protein, partial [Oscillospiraceae bacterium]
MGWTDEQYRTLGGRDDSRGTNLRLEYYDRRTEDKSLPFFHSEDDIKAILKTTPHLAANKKEISAFYALHNDEKERAEYIKSIFNVDYTEILIANKRRVGYKKMQNVLHLWEGAYISRTSQGYYDWGIIAKYYEGMIILGEFTDNASKLPSVGEQIGLIEAENTQKFSAFAMPQEVIDAVLRRGSGISNSHMRTYEQYQKGHTQKENADYLRAEYGNGGMYPAIIGTDIKVEYGSKGLEISHRKTANQDGEIMLSWVSVAHRIGELIQTDRYINKEEKDKYPDYLKEKAAAEERGKIGNEFNDIAREFNKYETEIKNTSKSLNLYVLLDCGWKFRVGDKITNSLTMHGDYILPLMRKAMADVIACDTKFSERAQNVLRLLDSEIAKPLEPTFDELNPPPEPVMEYHFSVGDVVYLTDGKYEVLAADDRAVRLYDETFPIFNKELSRADFIKELSMKHMNDRLLVESEIDEDAESEPVAEIKATEDTIAQTEKKPDSIGLSIGFSGHPAFYDREFHDRNTNLSFALGNKLLGVLDEKQHRERQDENNKVGWYHKTDFAIASVVGGEEFNYDGRFDIGDGEGDLIAHIKNYYDYMLSPDCPFTAEWKRKGEDYYREQIESLHNGRDIFVPFLEQHTELTPEDNHALAEIMATENEWFVHAEEAEENHYLQAEIVAPTADDIIEKEIKKPRNASSILFPEISYDERLNFVVEEDSLGTGAPKERFANNIAAIQVLKQIENDNRLATADEQDILARYVGWGGLSDAFDESKTTWSREFEQLKNQLTESEYAAARESTLTAFYTPSIVIEAMYKAIEGMGFKTGNILEPSCGTGNFLGMLPDSMSESKIYGVELDTISGRIAQQLYQKSSIAVQGYEKTELPDSFFDVSLGNVPFGQFKVADTKYDKHNFLIHDFFFAKTLDKVRPGGIIAFITSKGTMDKESPAVRKYIAQRADLIGAVRLPNNAFKASAGTEVTSDILFLQKRDHIVDIEPDWVYLSTDNNGIKMNQYFVDNPDMILGNMEMITGQYGMESACVPRTGDELAQLLDDAMRNINAEISEPEINIDDEANADRTILQADPNVRNFSYAIVDGQIYYREDSVMSLQQVSLTVASRIKGLIEIRDCVYDLIELQTEDFSDEQIKAEQCRLNGLYDTFAAKYGYINTRGNEMAFAEDSAYPLLRSLEVLDDENKVVGKADMFTKRTIKQRIIITHADTAVDALGVSLGEKACIDIEFMSSLMGGIDRIPDIINDLEGIMFKDPKSITDNHDRWVTADEYLSGNVRKKLAEAIEANEQSNGEFSSNVKALTAVQPKDLTAGEIYVKLGTTWLPTKVIEDFVFNLLDTPWSVKNKMEVLYCAHTCEWNITEKGRDRGSVKASHTYGTKRISAYKIIEDTLNLRDVRIFDTIYEDGKEKRVLNKKETAFAQSRQELIKSKFAEWIWENPKRREMICAMYNERFNSIRNREYDGSFLQFAGMNPEIKLLPHQINAAARIIYGGNTLLAHCVGAGKSYEMIAAAMESKRLGLCNKPLFVVPNNIVGQFASEFLQLYPSANVLMATKRDFEKKNRKKLCGRIATGEYDGVIIGHSQLEKIPMSIERQAEMLNRQISDIVDGINDMQRNNGEHYTVKQMEKTKKKLQAKLEKLNDATHKDSVVTFEQLGVDRLFTDEADLFKNLFLYTKMRNVGGIAQVEAQKSSDLYMKARYLDELTDNHGTIFATGTPVSNTMAELYTMQRYLQYDALERQGLQHFDAWAAQYGETVTAFELKPEGTGFQQKTRFAYFHNLPELMSLFCEVADIQTADMLKL